MNISLKMSLFEKFLNRKLNTKQLKQTQSMSNVQVAQQNGLTHHHGKETKVQTAVSPTPRPTLLKEKPAQRVARLLSSFDSISLSEMDNVALLNRVDTKFLFSIDDFYALLPCLATNYRVLQINQKRLSPYQNLYFDTADLSLYRQHHNGTLNRHKVRSREYVDSNLSFLEVKFKTNKKRTIKNRLQTEDAVTNFESDTESFMEDHYPQGAEKLLPVLWNNFTRITLVSKHAKERLTFDIDLRYRRDAHHTGLEGVVIAEVKQERFLVSSDVIQEMRRLGIRKSKFSKYCIGVSMLFDNVKTNNFKPILLFANKLAQRSIS